VRALICERDGVHLRLSVAEPVPGSREALIRPTRVLLTPADVAVAHFATGAISASGSSTRFTGVLGHQFVGVVEALGPADDGSRRTGREAALSVGTRVVASASIACSACDLCRRGLSSHCRARRVPGAHLCDGCLADRLVLPVGSLHAVPQGIPDDAAVFALALASATHAAGLLRTESHAYVTVLGESPLALLTALVLRARNATVRLLSASPAAIGLCERWGIKHRGLDEPGRRQDQDAVVDCTGTTRGLKLAMQLVRPRGTIMMSSPRALAPFPAGAALREPGPGAEPLDLTPAVVNEVHMVGAREGPLPEALAWLRDEHGGPHELAGLITRRIPLEQAAAAFALVGRADQLAILVDVSPES
jgi:alcohol dehydrogenase